ncbi:hypothetical protein [Mesorhizobium sp. M7A.F.Ca.MR.176.00.0.0]|uniref:hypothetical protein n=1 Tax=Mesorhizobium sp. M7A.F.Ca.MR.176.00.0.0 TaxID=2496776 RepID=UPI001FE01C81|nr:hypothetical protein [Mesorhizobium sp. M7A.F.Ca.MR.176.00.0.0]
MSNIETTDAKPDSGEREKIRTRANSGGSEDETDADHLRQSVERTERMRRLAARRYQVVRHRTRIENEEHAILHAHLIPKGPHADLFNVRGRAWLARQPVPDDDRFAIERHVRELDRLAKDLAILDRGIAETTLDDPAIRRLLTITGVNLAVAAGLMAAIGDGSHSIFRPRTGPPPAAPAARRPGRGHGGRQRSWRLGSR